jgi:hypothetical protein
MSAEKAHQLFVSALSSTLPEALNPGLLYHKFMFDDWAPVLNLVSRRFEALKSMFVRSRLHVNLR